MLTIDDLTITGGKAEYNAFNKTNYPADRFKSIYYQHPPHTKILISEQFI